MEIKIGTRKSKLALWQSEWVKSKIEAAFPDVKVTLVKIVTKGDKILDVPLQELEIRDFLPRKLKMPC